MASAPPTLDSYLDWAEGKRDEPVVKPWLSVVTTVFNARAALETTLASVRDQDDSGIEIVVTDGGSTDGTAEWLHGNPGRADVWISEKDSGIYDGMNRGIALARGETIAILNAGDSYLPGSLKAIREALEADPRIDILHGGLLSVRSWGGEVFIPAPRGKARGWEMPAHHPACFVKRRVYEAHGLFRTDFRIAADLEWMHRVLSEGVEFVPCDTCITRMPADGISNHGGNLAREEQLRVLEGIGASPEDIREWKRGCRRSDFRAAVMRGVGWAVPNLLRRRLAEWKAGRSQAEPQG